MNNELNELEQDEMLDEEFPEEGNFSASPNILDQDIPIRQPGPNISSQVNKGTRLPKPNVMNNKIPNLGGKQANNGANLKPTAPSKSGANAQNPKAPNPQNQMQQAKQQMVKEAAKAAANAAAGPVGGKAVEALSKTKTGQKILNKATNKLDPMKKLNPLGIGKEKKEEETEVSGEGDFAADIGKKVMMFGGIASFGVSGCFSGIILILIIAIIFTPLMYINELITTVGDALSDFGESLGNFLTFRGWCTDRECEEKEENNFYAEIEKVYDEYNSEKSVKLNATLLTATLTYTDPFTTTSDEETSEEDEEDDPNSVADLPSSNSVDFRKSKKKVRNLASEMVKEEDGEWTLDLEGYREYLENDFVRKFYYDNKTGETVDRKVKQTVDEIFSRASAFAEYDGSKGYTKVYAFCSGVTVTDTFGTIIGTYNLEEYVAGVVSGESYAGMNMEAYKAQAVVARTYVLNLTNNCTTAIENSQNNQVFEEDIKDYAREAAEATAGQVLLYDDKIFSTEYDSFCYDDESCTYGEEDGKRYVIYTKLPNKETHKVYLSPEYYNMINGGHGRGMSQVVSYEMAANGSTYNEILEYFYSPGTKLSTMIAYIGGNHISSSQIIKDKDELSIRSDLYREMGEVFIGGVKVDLSNIYSKSAGNLGQCVWFARSRALELIYYSDMDDATKLEAFNAVLSTHQNGEGWYRANTLDIFQKEPDYTKPVPGSILSWTSSTANGASHNYGHVAIVESVDYENQTAVISEGWNSGGPNGAESWANVVYQTKTMTFEEIKNYNSNRGYTFNGYVYILGQGE